MRLPSLRLLASHCRVSVATVSRALSGHPAVHPETRARIVAAAGRHGYDRNDLVGQLMSHVRRSRAQGFLGNLAVIHLPSPDQPSFLPAHRAIVAGARERARELGFQLYVFSASSDGFDTSGYARVLQARGVRGVIFLYTEPTETMTDFPWAGFASVGIDYGRFDPLLHTVSVDQYMTLRRALGRLEALGYRRIGLFLERYKDDRIAGKWSSAFTARQQGRRAGSRLPPLLAERITESAFRRWHRQHRPDLVVGHIDQAVAWLARAGVGVPEETAFFNLNWNARTRPCAGLDLRLDLQGAVAVETLVAQIQRGERGLPPEPRTILINGRWVDGPTLRPAPAPSERLP